jgi:hypothetical protein
LPFKVDSRAFDAIGNPSQQVQLGLYPSQLSNDFNNNLTFPSFGVKLSTSMEAIDRPSPE